MHAAMVNPFYVGKFSGNTVGSMVLNSDGSGSATFQVAENTTYNFTFCQYPSQEQGCPVLTTFTTDANGNAKISFQMPQKGTFVGEFVAETPNNAFYDSGFILPATGDMYLSPLVRASTVTGGIPNVVIGSEPLTSGQITANNSNTAHIAVQGAQPNNTYTVTFCFNTDGSSCWQAGTLKTDSAGNGSTDIGIINNNFDYDGVFHLDDANGVQYITAFTLR